jgi:hypothetical protein
MTNEIPYETLDPDDWKEMRALAHRMVDDAITYLETVRERPVWKPVPDDVAARFDAPALNALNKEILTQLQESGIAAPSYTTLHGRYCLRIAIANHRSKKDDFEILAREVVRLGRELVD